MKTEPVGKWPLSKVPDMILCSLKRLKTSSTLECRAQTYLLAKL